MKKIVYFCILFITCLSAFALLVIGEKQADANSRLEVNVMNYNNTTKGLDPYYGGLHSIHELNCETGWLDSHSDVTDISTLEIDYRRSYKINNAEFIEEGCLWYPRIKKLSNGRYILFFQDGRWGPNVYYTRSDNGIDWDKPTLLFESHPTGTDNIYQRNYATCDAIELSNGDIVVGAIFHAVKKNDSSPSPSRWNMSEKGIVTKISHDKGDSWSEQQLVYHGRCWEPSFLQLPDGTVQMYFTHSAPKDAIYGTKMGNNVSSGVAMLTSTDNGRRWSPLVLSYPYVAKRIAQQKIYEHNGIDIFTDQMPVAILLHDQKTILMSVESLRPNKSGHNTSIIRSHDFFERTLEENEYGPDDRDDNLISGAAPYIAQFPSGETVLSAFKSNKHTVYLGNATGTEFYLNRSYSPMAKQKVGMWGDLFVADSHTLLASAGDTIVEPGVTNNLGSTGIGITTMILNHRIDAKLANIEIDGDTSDWYDNTDALFAGSIDQAQTSVRLAHDSDNVYVLVEHLDYYISGKDNFVLMLKGDGDEIYRVYSDINGITKFEKIIGNTITQLPAIPGKTKIYGTVDNDSDKDEGVVIEFAIPKSYFNDSDTLRIFLKVFGYDKGKALAWDGFNGLTESNTDGWHIVRLSDKNAATVPPIEDVKDTTSTQKPITPLSTETNAEPTAPDTSVYDSASSATTDFSTGIQYDSESANHLDETKNPLQQTNIAANDTETQTKSNGIGIKPILLSAIVAATATAITSALIIWKKKK